MAMACFSFFALVLVFIQMHSCSCFNFSESKRFGWFPAGATWYGPPNGAGSDGGACGYGSAVEGPPFSAMVSAGGPSLFYNGKGCGACYQVKCTSHPACSRYPVRVTITDSCPGGPCVAEPVHFDLSGAAFGALAISGRADNLRNAGLLPVQYRRVACKYRGTNVAFHVDQGSNPYYFSVITEFEVGDGELRGLDLLQATSGSHGWIPMQQLWGANWKINSGSPLRAPFSLRITSDSGRILIANNVIPKGWQPGQTYRSVVNFHSQAQNK